MDEEMFTMIETSAPAKCPLNVLININPLI